MTDRGELSAGWDTQWTGGTTGAAPVDRPLPDDAAAGLSVAVIGAGAFGGWTAWHLLRAGARVTLVDAWGPGHARSSSGGESRVIRAVYGPDDTYVRWTAEARRAWVACDASWGTSLFHQTGVLWLVGRDDAYVRAALPHLAAVDWPYEELTGAEGAHRFGQMRWDDVAWGLFEPQGGYLEASRACRVLVDQFVASGGTYRVAMAAPMVDAPGPITAWPLRDGSQLEADRYVVAAGPWLPTLLPDTVGPFVRSSRQEVYYLGPPAGTDAFTEGQCPVWMDFGSRVFYGMPATAERGFKIADDTRGPRFDPTDGDRLPTPARMAEARTHVAHRFPGLAGAPVVETRVCQYANTPDGHLLLDRHPSALNVWVAGGGSGHGFKLGPVVGRYVAGLVVGDRPVAPMFGLDRLR